MHKVFLKIDVTLYNDDFLLSVKVDVISCYVCTMRMFLKVFYKPQFFFFGLGGGTALVISLRCIITCFTWRRASLQLLVNIMTCVTELLVRRQLRHPLFC